MLLWFGGIWKAAKHPANLGFFDSQGIAVIAVETRTMEDATADKAKRPDFLCAKRCRARGAVCAAQCRAVEPRPETDRGGRRLAGRATGAVLRLLGRSRERRIRDPVERESSLVTAVAAYRCQPTFDPVRMQEWVPGVKWGAPALGCSFEESLKRRDELLPILKKWSPDYLLHKDAAPMFFENEWGLTKPDNIPQANYDVHCPRWALGFQKLALAAGATCYVKFPGHPADEAAKDIWDFVARQLHP